MSRTVTLVLVGADGVPLGALPAYDVPAPWWQEMTDVVEGARRTHGIDVAVLRLLHTERPEPHGGAVTYLAQLGRTAPAAATLDLTPLDPATLDAVGTPHPSRAPWAEPGGPRRSLDWAADELARLGRAPVTGSQRRAWNLSTIWRLDPAEPAKSRTPVWLKQVPAFFRHEAAVLRWLGRVAPELAPPLLAADKTGRMLLDHVPGDDWYGVDVTGRDAIAADQHRIQLASIPYVRELVDSGVPDLRGARLARTVTDVLTASGADLSGVRSLLANLDARLAAIAACGLPDTLVHGDLHPGNVRNDGNRRVLIDWGDAFVGHPAFDLLRLSERLSPDDTTTLVRSWASRWRASHPAADPERALRLLRPVAALRNAAVYAHFVARIEPSERPFHLADVPHHLADAARLAG
ncbi:aminoglycoside phosphotransferase family protein [Micromonospora sp. NBC_01699]|uniref:aminoglycoside phosphotransferase family protein n=1 Tax=Micromonospora sp. NBC_01699 TaxID=2975984 RepID=UPI002E34F515|nr:aminoglycoside phosphotransferase family protein [Micromonospora sp. NBC_01699]